MMDKNVRSQIINIVVCGIICCLFIEIIRHTSLYDSILQYAITRKLYNIISPVILFISFYRIRKCILASKANGSFERLISYGMIMCMIITLILIIAAIAML